MKPENKKKADSLANLLLPKLTGLSEKGTLKMAKTLKKCTAHLAKKYRNLQEEDSIRSQKLKYKNEKNIVAANNVSASVVEKSSDGLSGNPKPAKITVHTKPKAIPRTVQTTRKPRATAPKTIKPQRTTTNVFDTLEENTTIPEK